MYLSEKIGSPDEASRDVRGGIKGFHLAGSPAQKSLKESFRDRTIAKQQL